MFPPSRLKTKNGHEYNVNSKVRTNKTESVLENGQTDFLSRNKMRNKTVVVIGLGYAGLPLALLAAENGYIVIGFDLDRNKIDLLRKKISPFENKKISEALHSSGNLPVSNNPIFIKEAGIIVICIPTTLSENNQPDYSGLIKATELVSNNMQKDSLVIIESTVSPGVCETIILPILESGSGLKIGKDFELSHCPERVNPGDSKWDLGTINRVVGSITPSGLRKTASFYRSIINNGEISTMKSIKEAEAVKIVENSFRDINIAFVNELAMVFGTLGIDIVNVIKGAETKPFGFMAHYPGYVGGQHIPFDPYFLIEFSKKKGIKQELLMLARAINNNIPEYTVSLLEDAMESANLKIGTGKITILGASYELDIEDLRESPAFIVKKILEEKGYQTEIYDPIVKDENINSNLNKSLEGSIAVMIATSKTSFIASITPELLEKHGIKVIVDGHNCLNKKIFKNSQIIYRGVGR